MGQHAARDKLFPGEWFGVGDAEALRSASNEHGFSLDADGYMRVHRAHDILGPWGPGAGSHATRAVMGKNGSLVVVDDQGRAVWQTTSSTGYPNPFLLMQDDGNVVIYEVPPSGVWHPIWTTNTQEPSFASQVWSRVQDAADFVMAAANALQIPGVNVQAALLTGHDPIAGLKLDVSNFQKSAQLAQAVTSGNAGQVASIVAQGLPPSVRGLLTPQVAQALTTAAQAGDAESVLSTAADLSGVDPSKVAAMVSSPGYQALWTVLTNAGQTAVAQLPAPPGLTYQPDAKPYVPPRPVHVVSLHTGGAPPPATPPVQSAPLKVLSNGARTVLARELPAVRKYTFPDGGPQVSFPPGGPLTIRFP